MLVFLTKKTSEKEQKQKEKKTVRVKLKLIWIAQMVKCAVKTLTMYSPRMRGRSVWGPCFSLSNTMKCSSPVFLEKTDHGNEVVVLKSRT